MQKEEMTLVSSRKSKVARDWFQTDCRLSLLAAALSDGSPP